MILVREGEEPPAGTMFFVMVTEQESRFLEGVPERKRWAWIRRLRSGRTSRV